MKEISLDSPAGSQPEPEILHLSSQSSSAHRLTRPTENEQAPFQNSDLLSRLPSDISQLGRQAVQVHQSDPNLLQRTEFIQSQADTLSTRFDDLLCIVPQRILALKRQSNALQPINQLPLEVLTDVLWNVVLPVLDWCHYDKVYLLMRVCGWWAEIVTTTPRFWCLVSAASYRLDPDFIILGRAVPSLSRIGVQGCIVEGKIFVPDSLVAVADVGRRWRSVDFLVQDDDDEEGVHLSQPPCSQLDDITLSLPWNHPAFDLQRLLNDQTVHLRHLHIKNSPFTCPPNTLQSLSTLTLGNFFESPHHQYAMSPGMLRTALQCAPHLRTLKLMDVQLSCCENTPTLETVLLLELDTFVWMNGKARDQEAFLSSVKMPLCSSISFLWTRSTYPRWKQLRLPFNTPHQPRHVNKEALASLQQSLGRIVGQSTEASILLHHGTHRRSFRFTTLNHDRSPGLDVQVTLEEWECFTASVGLHWVLDLFGSQLAERPVSLKLAGLQTRLLDLHRVLELSSTVNLTLHGSAMDSPHPLIDFLSYRQLCPKSRQLLWPLPELRSLTIRSSRSILPFQLLSLIRNRYSANQTHITDHFGTKPGVNKGTGLPARFKSIDILYRASEKKAMTFDTVASAKIRHLVGEGVFTQRLSPNEDRHSLYLTGDINWSGFDLGQDDVWDEVFDEDEDKLE